MKAKLSVQWLAFLSPVLLCSFGVALFAAPPSAHAITINWVTVGDIGNAGDVQPQGTIGAVGYEYRIGKHEVTNTQYIEFLNDVAASDPYALYNTSMDSDTRGGIIRSGSSGSYTYSLKTDAVGQGPGGTDYTYADKPVVWVSWYDAVRFANWLTSGATESGTYTISGGGPNSGTVTVPDHSTFAAGSNTFFLPSDDEWYKAAYYDGGTSTYFDYPIGTDSVPNNNLPSADTGNSANFNLATGDANYPLTDVGDYLLSASPYGTFDQGGNIAEWNEGPGGGGAAFIRGGSWDNVYSLAASERGLIGWPAENHDLGFRIASSAAVCLIGDADCDGDVDIADDIIPAFSAFTGPGSFGMTRADGDVHGPSVATTNPDGHDGDVDVQDLLTMFGNFTGPLDESGLAALEAGDPSVPDLIYDSATGEVVLDMDGAGIIGYVLKNGDGTFIAGNHTTILGGVSTSLGNELSEAAFASADGSIGFVFPTGMDLATLTAYLTTNEVSTSLGAPVVPFDLVVLGPAVPEPSAFAMAGVGLIALGFYGWRRRAR